MDGMKNTITFPQKKLRTIQRQQRRLHLPQLQQQETVAVVAGRKMAPISRSILFVLMRKHFPIFSAEIPTKYTKLCFSVCKGMT